jgi:hypothetical protein
MREVSTGSASKEVLTTNTREKTSSLSGSSSNLDIEKNLAKSSLSIRPIGSLPETETTNGETVHSFARFLIN